MNKYQIFFVINFLVFEQFHCAKFFKNRVIKVTVLQECPDRLNLTDRYVNITLTTDATRKVLINALLIHTKDLPGTNIQTQITLTRCKSQDSPDTCESFQTLKFPNLCTAFIMKGQVWSTFTNAVEPPGLCPIKKGIQVVKNGYFDADSVPFPIPLKTYWKVRTETYYNNEILSCLYGEGSVVQMK